MLSTAACAGLYLLLRTATGPAAANALALVLAAIGNTAADRQRALAPASAQAQE